MKAIKQLKSNEAVEYLGFFARPDGNPEPHSDKMKAKIKMWVTKVKGGDTPYSFCADDLSAPIVVRAQIRPGSIIDHNKTT